jgi:hypothetical protein
MANCMYKSYNTAGNLTLTSSDLPWIISVNETEAL